MLARIFLPQKVRHIWFTFIPTFKFLITSRLHDVLAKKGVTQPPGSCDQYTVRRCMRSTLRCVCRLLLTAGVCDQYLGACPRHLHTPGACDSAHSTLRTVYAKAFASHQAMKRKSKKKLHFCPFEAPNRCSRTLGAT